MTGATGNERDPIRDKIENAAYGISQALHDLRWTHGVPMPGHGQDDVWIGDLLPADPAEAMAFLRTVADRLEKGIKETRAGLRAPQLEVNRRAKDRQGSDQ
jgi:hypothetical protein